jgi:hypothetical protein
MEFATLLEQIYNNGKVPDDNPFFPLLLCIFFTEVLRQWGDISCYKLVADVRKGKPVPSNLEEYH